MKTIKLASTFWIPVLAIWGAWIVIAFTEKMYYSDNPSQLAFILMKIRVVQGFNGMWLTLLLFAVYRRLLNANLSAVPRGVWVVALTYLFSLVCVLINMSVYRFGFDKTPLMLPWERYLVVAFSKFFIFLGLSIFFFLIVHWQALQAQKEKTLTAVALANEAQLQMLRYQLNPHFLFNALNSIRTLVYEAPQKAEKMITDLSDLLRYTLSNENDHIVTLADEMEVIRNYLQIQKIRFEEQLIVDLNVAPEAMTFKVPCFLIHPLVENAIKYGLQSSPPPLRIAIDASIVADTLSASVCNTGTLYPDNGQNGCGTGLKNIRKRLDHFFPQRNSFELFEAGGRVHAMLQITAQGNTS